MIVGFFRGLGIKNLLAPEEYHTADVVIENRVVLKNRFGMVGIKLTPREYSDLHSLTLDQIQAFFTNIGKRYAPN